jgi:hypothetical protein
MRGRAICPSFWIVLLTEYSRIRNRTHPMLASTRALHQLDIGVADGARTHDNRNHNLGPQASTGAACRPILGIISVPLTHDLAPFPAGLSRAGRAARREVWIPPHRAGRLGRSGSLEHRVAGGSFALMAITESAEQRHRYAHATGAPTSQSQPPPRANAGVLRGLAARS